jgi:phosphate transport system permease protein
MSSAVTDKRPSTLRGASLPKWSPWAILGGSVVLGIGIGLAAGLDSKIQ